MSDIPPDETSIDPILIQKCAACQFFKPIDQFRKQNNRPPLRVKAYCLECDNEYNRRRYQNKREKILKRQKRWNNKHKFRLKKYKEQWKKNMIKKYYGIDLDL